MVDRLDVIQQEGQHREETLTSALDVLHEELKANSEAMQRREEEARRWEEELTALVKEMHKELQRPWWQRWWPRRRR